MPCHRRYWLVVRVCTAFAEFTSFVLRRILAQISFNQFAFSILSFPFNIRLLEMYSTNRLKVDGDHKISRNLNMIKLFYQNKDYATAKSYVNDLLVAKPNSSEAYKLLSQINEALGEHEQAIKNYKKSLDLRFSDDPNSSFENSYQFTPTKISSPVVNNSVNKVNHQNQSSPADSNLSQIAFDKFEKIFEKKVAVFEKSFDSISKQLSHLNDYVKKNVEEISAFKKNFTSIATKQDQLANKFLALSDTNSKIFDELFNLKEAVNKLSERGNISNISDFDEDDDYDDYENENYDEQSAPQPNIGQLPKLNELFKVSQDTWRCDCCQTANSKSDPFCPCCEAPNPNIVQSQPKINGPMNAGTGGSTFKFGVQSSSTPSFGFGTASQNTIPAFTSFGIKPVSSTNLFPAAGSNINENQVFTKPTVSSNLATTNAVGTFGNNLNSGTTFLVPKAANSLPTNSIQENNSTLTTMISEKPQTLPFNSSMPTFSFAGALNSLNGDVKNSTTTNVPTTNSGLFSFSKSFPTSTSAFSFNLKSSQPPPNTLANTSAPLPLPSFITNKPIFSSENSNSITSSNPIFSFSNSAFNSSLLDQSTKSNAINGPKNQIISPNKDEEENVHDHANDSTHDSDYFKLPDVKLPDNYEQVTGEENEGTLFEMRAKLYVFKDDEYKERGVGIIKILKDKKTQKCRVLMRRELILKVCLNSHISDITKFEIADKKSLRFSCIDFDEGKPTSGVFLLRFGNEKTLSEFKNLIESLQEAKNITNTTTDEQSKPDDGKQKNGNLEVELVYFKQPKAENLKKVRELHLPINFYDYEEKSPCKGCIGCQVDSLNWNELTQKDLCDGIVDSQKDSGDNFGLFSSIATDLNLKQNRVNTIENAANENDHMPEQNFVSEKSKLLPQNFEAKTGEEDEEVIFNERGKMYHFVDNEWKERGVGNMKILKQKDSNKCRLLMRREKILNVICNHAISEHLQLKPFSNSNNTWTWFSKDYSDNPEGIDELFALKFKNETLLKKFENDVKECIQKLSS